MSRNGFIRQTVAGVMALSLLLSGCRPRRMEDRENVSKSNDADAKTITGTTSEVLEAGPVTSYADIFYHAEKKTLSFPDLQIAFDSSLIYSECAKPIFTENYILAYVSQTYGTGPNYAYSNYSQTYVRENIRYFNRWVVFDTQGNYLGDLSLPEIPAEAVFDQDEQGNIVAAYSGYVSNEEYEGWAVYVAQFAPSGELLMDEPRIWVADQTDPVGFYMGEDGEIVFATTSALYSANLDGTIHAVCTFPEDFSCIGLWEENHSFYTLLFPTLYVTDVYEEPADANDYGTQNCSILMPFTVSPHGYINIAGEGKVADGLLTMHITPSEQGFCAATKNAIGAFDFSTGEFCSLLDWNQTDADRSLITGGRFKVLSEGAEDQPLDMLAEGDIMIPGLSINTIERKLTVIPSAYESGQGMDTVVLPSENVEETEVQIESSNMTTTASPSETEMPSETTNTSDLSAVDGVVGEETMAVPVPQEDEDQVTMISVATTEICEYGSVPVLLTIAPVEGNPHADKQVVWIGGVNLVESPVTAAVAKYNADPDHSIWIKLHEYTDYNCNDDYGVWSTVFAFSSLNELNFGNLISNDQRAMEKMIEQVSSGNGPDIIYGAGEIGTLDQRGYLTDLLPYMTGKNGIDQEKYFTSVFDAFKVNGHLYQIPLSFNLVGMIQQTSQSGVSVRTFKDYLALSNSSGLLSFDYSSVTQSVLYMASAEMNNWINYDTEEKRVTQETMEDFLKVSEKLYRSNGQDQFFYESLSWAYAERYFYFHENNYDIPVNLNVIGSIEEYCRNMICMADYEWTGLPGASSGTTAAQTSNTVGIAAYSTQKEQAWLVISELLSKDAQVTMNAHASTPEGYGTAEFPVMREAFFVEEYQLIDSGELFLFFGEDRYMYTSSPAKSEILKDLEEMLSAPHRRFVYDEEALTIILEGVSAYLSGESTCENCADTMIRHLNQLGDN